MMTVAGSTTINVDGCELFETTLDHDVAIANLGATSASKPRGITAEIVTGMW